LFLLSIVEECIKAKERAIPTFTEWQTSTPKKRAAIPITSGSQIKGKNTKPEMLVRKFLHANGYRKLRDKSQLVRYNIPV
jgi:hypothetical protein